LNNLAQGRTVKGEIVEPTTCASERSRVGADLRLGPFRFERVFAAIAFLNLYLRAPAPPRDNEFWRRIQPGGMPN
jgi:hypothetical protein